MAKSLFEEPGGKYERQGDYLIPCLTVPTEEEQPRGRLNTYLADIDRQAQERFERLIDGMKQTQGINGTVKGRKRLRMDRTTQ